MSYSNSKMSDNESKEDFSSIEPYHDLKTSSSVFQNNKITEFESGYSLCVFSWNIGGKVFDSEFDINEMINACNKGNPPDIIIFGFQEIVPLNFFSFLKNTEAPQQIENLISGALKEVFSELKYKCFANTSLMGLAIICYCKSEIRELIKHINTSIVKTGFKGYVGNKGCVSARFIIDNISVVAGCCHLECGAKGSESRLKNIDDITSSMFSEYEEGYSFYDHDIKILFGDLNFRVDLPYEKVMDIEKEIIN